jgi:hypothetical protein
LSKGERYSKVSRRLWNDEGFRSLSAPPPNGQTLWQRLLTGPELTNVPGCFQAWDVGLAKALGWSLEGFLEAFGEVFREGMAEADWEVGFVWVPKAIVHNKPESPNVVKSWRATWDQLPECALKLKAYRALKAFVEGLGEAYAKAFAEACTGPSVEPFANQEQEQEQEQEQLGAPKRAAPPPIATPDRRIDPLVASFSPPSPIALHAFEAWATAFGKTGVTFDSKRAACLADRVRDGMTAQDATDVIAAAAADPWHNGDKDGEKRTKLITLFGDVERYEELRDKGRALRERPSGTVRKLPSPQERQAAEFARIEADARARGVAPAGPPMSPAELQALFADIGNGVAH